MLEEFLSSYKGIATTIINIVIIIFFCGIAVAITWLILKIRKKKYIFHIYKEIKIEGKPFLVFVGKDSGVLKRDSKLKTIWVYMKKAKTYLKVDGFHSIPTMKGKELVLLLKHGFRKYSYIESKIENNLIRLTITNEDTSDSIRAFDTNALAYSQSTFEKYLPLVIIGVVGVIVLVIIGMLLNKFELINQAAESLKQASQNMGASPSSAVASNAPV